MRRALLAPLLALAVAALAAALAVPPADAVPAGAGQGPTAPGAACLASAPPCGYITPIIDLQFPDKPRCPGAPGTVTLEDCGTMPAVGESVTYKGRVKWYWKLSEDLTYPPDPAAPIVLSFSPTASNPDYLTFTVEPAEFTIDTATLFDPQHMEVDQTNPAAPSVYYVFDPEVTVTITRTGEPSYPDEMDRIVDRDGLQSLFVKARSSASGEYFKESFGVEEFRFDARPLLPAEAQARLRGEPVQDAPVPSGLLAGLALLGAALARRR